MIDDKVAAHLTQAVAAGIRVLRERDGLPVGEPLCQERADQIVKVIQATYDVLPPCCTMCVTLDPEWAEDDPEVTRR